MKFGLSIFLSGMFCMASSVRADSISELSAHDVHPGARADLGDENNGAGPQIIVAGTSLDDDFAISLIRWTLESVPAGHQATGDATVTLNVQSHKAFTGKQFEVYRIESTNAGWIEGDGGAGSPDADGEATYNSLAHGVTAWDGGPGLGNPGDGYDAAPLYTHTYDGVNLIQFTVAQSIVNDWISNPSQNAGLLLRGIDLETTEKLIRFHSRNAADPLLGPTISFETSAQSMLDGDLNGDGFVGQDDLNLVLASWGQTVGAGDPADPNGDLFIGQDDLNPVLADWGQGTPPGGLSAVPEPQSLLLALGGAGILAFVRLRRRRAKEKC